MVTLPFYHLPPVCLCLHDATTLFQWLLRKTKHRSIRSMKLGWHSILNRTFGFHAWNLSVASEILEPSGVYEITVWYVRGRIGCSNNLVDRKPTIDFLVKKLAPNWDLVASWPQLVCRAAMRDLPMNFETPSFTTAPAFLACCPLLEDLGLASLGMAEFAPRCKEIAADGASRSIQYSSALTH